MCFNPSPVRRVPSPNRYMAVARFCFCKNNKRTIDLVNNEGDGGEGAEVEAARCIILYCISALYYIILYYALYYIILYYIILRSSMGRSVCAQ